MRTISVVGLILVLSISARAQSTASYQQSASVIDSSGNLIVFDSGYTVTTVSTSGSTGASIGFVSLLGGGFSPTSVSERIPTTRITVVPHGATAASTPVVYPDSSFQLIGAGKDAVYALVTVYPSNSTRPSSQEIVAINFPLAGSLSAFPSLPVGAGVNIELGPAGGASDYLSLITGATGATSTVAATPRTVKVYSFTTSFQLVSQGNLP